MYLSYKSHVDTRDPIGSKNDCNQTVEKDLRFVA